MRGSAVFDQLSAGDYSLDTATTRLTMNSAEGVVQRGVVELGRPAASRVPAGTGGVVPVRALLWGERLDEMFAVPQGLGDPRTFEALSQLAGRDACEDPRIANDNAADALAEAGRIQMPLEQFDIGQFRHRLLRRCPRARFFRNGDASIDGEPGGRW